jgi:hypothetical protein
VHSATRLEISSDRILQRTATSTSTTRLDFALRCNVDAPRPSTSTTRFNFGLCRSIRVQQRRVRLLRLREDGRQLADDYFNYSSRLEN